MCEDLIGREVGKKSEICYTKQAVKYIERRREEDSKERYAKKSRKNTELKQNVCKNLILPRHSSVYVYEARLSGRNSNLEPSHC